MKITVNASWRYFVWGVYMDREEPIVRFYPIPFVRISLDFTDWP
jgi:hypothetical protein